MPRWPGQACARILRSRWPEEGALRGSIPLVWPPMAIPLGGRNDSQGARGHRASCHPQQSREVCDVSVRGCLAGEQRLKKFIELAEGGGLWVVVFQAQPPTMGIRASRQTSPQLGLNGDIQVKLSVRCVGRRCLASFRSHRQEAANGPDGFRERNRQTASAWGFPVSRFGRDDSTSHDSRVGVITCDQIKEAALKPSISAEKWVVERRVWNQRVDEAERLGCYERAGLPHLLVDRGRKDRVDLEGCRHVAQLCCNGLCFDGIRGGAQIERLQVRKREHASRQRAVKPSEVREVAQEVLDATVEHQEATASTAARIASAISSRKS